MTNGVSHTTAPCACGHNHDHLEIPSNAEFLAWCLRMQQRYESIVRSGTPMFLTNAQDLFDTYINLLPNPQHHNCHACRHFIESYGSLATVSDDGVMASVLWDEDLAPSYYKKAVRAMHHRILESRVVGLFLPESNDLGACQGKNKDWWHFAISAKAVRNASQKMAEKLEEYRMVCRALSEFSKETIGAVHHLVSTDQLYQSEKFQGPLKWLVKTKAIRENYKGVRRENLTWLQVATAPTGYCHIKSSVIGSLLEDLQGGMNMDRAAQRFKDKMHPLHYQRPQAAPTLANIQRGEELVAELGIANALRRRYATINDIRPMWMPHPEKSDGVKTGGVFASLLEAPEYKEQMLSNPTRMTWARFSGEVLPGVLSMEYQTRSPDFFGMFTTSVDPMDPPLFKWDNEDNRNPLSWYTYTGGTMPGQWNLPHGFVQVKAVSQYPSELAGMGYLGSGIMLVLNGARDTRQSGLALFPSLLRGELHEVRATIEAYSAKGKIQEACPGDPLVQHAAGRLLSPNTEGDLGCLLKVRLPSGSQLIHIDRMV